MCGITGWINLKDNMENKHRILVNMTNVLSHRGPDASNIWLTTHAAMGHTRLIVVDPAGGGQPMTLNVNGNTYTICYNGELYNNFELRKRLLACGHRFKTRNSDTETLLVSYIEWGDKCVEQLDGIFAFAIWDEKEQHLFLARDRVGVKPLFYAPRGDNFLFASEIKSLLANPLVKPEINAEGLAEIFVLGPSRTPGQGILCGVNELKPGYCMIYNAQGIHIRQYWSLQSHAHEDDVNKTAENLRFLLGDAVVRQLVADVPVCTLLSGGLDSSAITAFAAQGFKDNQMGKLRSFSVDYENNDQYFHTSNYQPDSDSYWVKKVSDFIGTEHHYVTINNLELCDALIPALKYNDVPGMADIDSSLYLFSRAIKQEATVALSGECADEVLGGYPWFHRPELLHSDNFPWIKKVKERAAMLSDDMVKMISPEEYVADRYHDALAEVPRLPGEDPEDARIREMFYLNITRFMPTLLNRKDRMTMAWGLEVRVPFSDHHLIEYVWNIPWKIKKYNNMPKGILRLALKNILSDEILNRPKSPYPKTHHPVYMEAVKTQIKDILNDPSAPLLPLINVEAVKKLLYATSTDPVYMPWFGQLMGEAQYYAYLIQVNTWLKNYKIIIR